MQMHEQIMMVEGQEQPISRTYQYRKVRVIPISYRRIILITALTSDRFSLRGD